MESTRHAHPDDSTGAAPQSAPPAPRHALLRWGPLAVVILALFSLYALGLHDYFSLETLRRYRVEIGDFVASAPIFAAVSYVLIYAAAVAVSFPGASFLTIAGGFLFGAIGGTLFAAFAATLGAILIFLAARTSSLGDILVERAGPRVQRLRQGFLEEGFAYLLFLRLVPLFPFWLVNLAAALFGMRLVPYVAATAIGILPGSFVFAYFGKGLGTALEREGAPASAELFIGLALLGVMALVPLTVRRFRRGRQGNRAGGRPEA